MTSQFAELVKRLGDGDEVTISAIVEALTLEDKRKADLDAAVEVLKRERELEEQIAGLDGFTLKYPGPFFNEFVVSCPAPSALIIDAMSEQGIAPGIDLSRFFPAADHDLLICVTEKHSPAQLDRYITALKKLARTG